MNTIGWGIFIATVVVLFLTTAYNMGAGFYARDLSKCVQYTSADACLAMRGIKKGIEQ